MRITPETLGSIYKYVDDTPFDISSLGHHYEKEKTSFRVYAPTHRSLFLILDQDRRFEMEQSEGTFSIEIYEDLEGHTYHFERSDGVSFPDPFSYADTVDGKDSYVLDPDRFRKEKVDPGEYETPVLYEISIRDFSSALDCAHPKKFLALTEEGLQIEGESAGIDYLQELGITHVQIMPVFDYDDDIKHGKDYNWGYNPLSYSVLKKDYICDKQDPYASVNEFRMMVDTLHSHSLRVVPDVVFNHVYKIATSTLDKMIPYYFFRYRPDMKPADGTWCGSEVRSEGKFVRVYLSEMVRRYIEVYDIDGLRFDLMGILDSKTVKAIHETAVSLKEDFLMYGEGWNMGEVLPEDLRASENNLPDIDPVGVFNRYFRDYVFLYLIEKEDVRKNIMRVLAGSREFSFARHQSINYVECHDNQTFYDKVSALFLNEEHRRKLCRMALGMVLLSRGIPFLHSGEEFYRTKGGIENSFNAPDSVNKLDWRRRAENKELVEYTKKLIRLRKENPEFYENSVLVGFRDYYEVLVYCLGDLRILINPCIFDHIYKDEHTYEILLDEKGEGGKIADAIPVPSHSIVVSRIYKKV